MENSIFTWFHEDLESQLTHDCYTILYSMTDHLLGIASMHEAIGMMNGYPAVKIREQPDFSAITFCCKEVLKKGVDKELEESHI